MPDFSRRSAMGRGPWRGAVLLLLTAAGAACGLVGPDGTRRTLDVAAHKAVCAGLGWQFCLQVREVGSSAWTYMYETPRDFEFEWGVATRIVVEEREIENPPQDASSIRRTLVRVVSREVLPPNTPFSLVIPGGGTTEVGGGVHRFDFGSGAMACADQPDCGGLAQALRGDHAVEVTLHVGPTAEAPFEVVAWRGCGQPWPGCG